MLGPRLSDVPEEDAFLRCDEKARAVTAGLKSSVRVLFSRVGASLDLDRLAIATTMGIPDGVDLALDWVGTGRAFREHFVPMRGEPDGRKAGVYPGTSAENLIDAALGAGFELALEMVPESLGEQVNMADARAKARNILRKGVFQRALNALEDARLGMRKLVQLGQPPSMAAFQKPVFLARSFGITVAQAARLRTEADALANQKPPLLPKTIARRLYKRLELALDTQSELLANILGREAINAAQQALFRQAAEQELFDETLVLREWIARVELGGVCERCRAFHRTRSMVNGWFESRLGELAERPGIHPRCFPSGVSVVPFGGIERHFSRWYEGELLVIRTASGKELPVTPNHPILTEAGWVPAGSLHVGSYVLSSPSRDWHSAVRHMNDNDIPAMIQEVSQSPQFSGSSVGVKMKVSPEDFHGDGIGSNVAIVRTNRQLVSKLAQSGLLQHLNESELLRTSEGQFGLFLDGAFKRLLNGLFPPPCREMCRRYLQAPLSFVHSAPLYSLGLSLASNGNSSFQEMPPNNRSIHSVSSCDRVLGVSGNVGINSFLWNVFPGASSGRRRSPHLDADFGETLINERDADSKLVGDLRNGIAGVVAPDKVVSINSTEFSGHVYNLQTGSGAYWANGIITHNCRCGTRLVRLRTRSEPEA